MNRLKHEESPYLQQHKDNPVDWHAWNEETFKKAKKENKPVLLSIGYSTCHWCHVMERESFEDEGTADLMNRHFINIKLDREEHPAVDNYYMSAVQLLTGSGGWPLNCFLTPDLKPYFGGTYFPPEDRHGRPSWKKVVERMSIAYKEQHDEVMEQAEKLSKLVEQGSSRFVEPTINIGSANKLNIESWIHTLQKELDLDEGGLNSAPKFPSPHIYCFLLNYAVFDHNKELVEFLKRTAHAFIDGGLFDPVHGGFARYCVDDKWKVPHFEKMLYDNAGIMSFLARMQSFYPAKRWTWAIKRTLDFWTSKMKSDEDLFFSAVDADSEGEEGKYYTWSMEELRAALSENEVGLLSKYAEISENGNWEGTNILFTRPEKRENFFKTHDNEEIDKVLNKLKEKAKDRVHPGIDDKILLDWNAMMVSALLNVSRYVGEQPAKVQALKTLASLEDKFVDDAEIKGHVYKNGKAYADAILDDYAYLIAAYLDAYENTFEEKYLNKAERLCRTAMDHFSRKDHPLLIISFNVKNEFIGKQPTFFDSPYPCGNSVMAHNLRKLGIIFDQQDWKDKAREMMASLMNSVGKFPSSFGNWADLGLQMEEMDSEIAVMGPNAMEWGSEISSSLLPGLIIMASEKRTSGFPLLDRPAEKNNTAIYLCQNYACQKPVHSLKEFTNLRSQTLNY